MGEMASNLLLYTESWIVENAVLGWLDPWKKANWQCRGKPIWADESWQEITALVEKLSEEVHCEMHVCLRVRLLKNIVIMDCWIRPPRLKCLRLIWSGNVRANYF